MEQQEERQDNTDAIFFRCGTGDMGTLYWSKGGEKTDPEKFPQMRCAGGLIRFALRYPRWAWGMRAHLWNLARKGQLSWW